MRTIAVAAGVVSICARAGIAAAEPTAQELEDRASSRRQELAGQGYTVFVEAPFVVIGDSPAAEVRTTATHFLRRITHELETDFFPKRPDALIEVWLFKSEQSFRAGAKKFFDDAPDTPYGYYSPTHHALVMNSNGLGTLSHELVHPYMEANFPGVPAWFNEGVASLFERPSERAGHIIGLSNWRLPNLKTEIRKQTLPPLTTLMETTDDDFYAAKWDAYAQARYLMFYLQEHGKLHAYYDQFRASAATDKTGEAALAAVLGEDLAKFDDEWRTWVLAVKGDNR